VSLQLNVSQRFIKKYMKASVSLQDFSEGCVHDFVRRYRSNPKTVSQNYDRLAGFGHNRVLELDITGSHRMLARYTENQLFLLDMGGHEVVGEYSVKKYNTDISSPELAPKQFWPENRSDLFLSLPDPSTILNYQEEITPDWLFFLEDEQEGAVLSIIEDIEKYETSANFIIGGPGTGKTCVLLNLLKWFIDSEYQVGIMISDKLADFIEKSMFINIADFRVRPFHISEVDILLVDDPTSLYGFSLNSTIHVVAAFDPLQLSVDITDGNFQDVISKLGANLYKLNKCYRQKKNVGMQTKKIIDSIGVSTPFLNEEKIWDFRNERKEITASANELEFVNPHGYVQKYPGVTAQDVQVEVNRILASKQYFWKHAPSILILSIGCHLPESFNQILAPIRKKGRFTELPFNRIEDIKGLEFQHVLIFINQTLYSELDQGFKGSGQRGYNARRLLRIPFSRAKDSVAVFCVN
jgi:hypothetical protein